MRMLNESDARGPTETGWHFAAAALADACNGSGLILDDFVERTWIFDRRPAPVGPWCGIFHFPPEINSPYVHDRKMRWGRVSLKSGWLQVRENLRGTVALSAHLASDLEKRLRVPVLVAKHPVQRGESWEGIRECRRLVQVGTFLRDTRAIHKATVPPGWERARRVRFGPNVTRKDAKLRTRHELPDPPVQELHRFNALLYDRLLATSVVLSWVYGASANNVVVECIARGTPLIINPHPAVVEYLGEDYPLYCDDLRDVEKLLEPSRLVDANEWLVGLQGDWLAPEKFAADVRAFVEGLSE